MSYSPNANIKDTNGNTINATNGNLNVSGPLTDAQLRASAVPTSLATLPALVASSAVIGHVIVDTAPTTTVTGAKTNNNAAPGATNIGTLPALANAPPPTWVEGNQVSHSTDLGGNLRVYAHPMNALGFYSWGGTTGTYAGLAANTPLFSMRWSDATKKAVILKVEISVITTVAASAAAITERQLIIARSFTVADTGGTAVNLTGNNLKRRTSFASTAFADIRIGAPLTAGTRTLDAAPVAVANAWTPVNFTGVTIGASASAATGAAWSAAGISNMFTLLNALNGQEYPIVLAANEGIVVRLGAAEPTSATQQTFINVVWAEVPTDY